VSSAGLVSRQARSRTAVAGNPSPVGSGPVGIPLISGSGIPTLSIHCGPQVLPGRCGHFCRWGT